MIHDEKLGGDENKEISLGYGAIQGMEQRAELHQLRAHFSTIETLSQEQVTRLICSARKSITTLLARCVEALEEENDKELDIAAHTLKGTLLQCGLSYWAECAQNICRNVHSKTGKKRHMAVTSLLNNLQNGLKNIVLSEEIFLETDQTAQLGADSIAEKSAPVDSIAIRTNAPVILFVDDDAVVRDVVQGMLHYLGYSCDIAESGEKGIMLYMSALEKGNSYALVLADLSLHGGMDGVEMIRQLHLLDPHVQIIVSSGHLSDTFLQKDKGYGIVECLRKPYTVEGLSRALTHVLHENANS